MRVFLTFLALIFTHSIWSETSEHDFRGIPYYRFYGAKDFESSASASFIATASDGTIFYCDRNWIFLYDGSQWQKVYQNNTGKNRITSLFWDDNGKIYAGSSNSIGEFVLDENNNASYLPLEDPNSPIESGEFFQTIKATETTVYFQGRLSFAIYDKESGSIDSHVFTDWVTASFFYEGQYHIVNDSNEILRYENNEFVLIPKLTKIAQSLDITIADTEVHPDGSIIMGSENRGIYKFDGTVITKAYPNFKEHPEHILRDLTLTDDGRLILAFLEGGILVLDDDGNTLERFSENVDPRFKSARGVTVDSSGAVWCMFNASIAKVLLDSPLTPIDERLRPSFFYAVPAIYEGDLYALTFYNLYRATYDSNNRIKGFNNALPNSELEIRSMAPSRDGLYLSTALNGIFLYKDGETKQILNTESLDRFLELKKSPGKILGANKSNLILYSSDANGLHIEDQIKNPAGFINRMAEDKNGTIWFEYGFGAIGKAVIENNQIKVNYYRENAGIPQDTWMTLWMHEGEALFTHNTGPIKLDTKTEKFIHDDTLDKIFPDGGLQIERVFTDPKGNIWISANKRNSILWKNTDGTYQVDIRTLSEMGEPYFEFLSHFDNGETIIFTDFEAFHYNPLKNLSNIEELKSSPTRILRISSIERDHLYFNYLGDKTTPEGQSFPYQENSLSFTVGNNFSYSTSSPVFQYFLKGFRNETIPSENDPWINDSTTHYTNLDDGDYVFMVRSRIGNGHITPWIEYPFSVRPPYYQTIAAYFLYIAILLALIVASINFYSRRLKIQNLKLEEMVFERTSEIESKNLELEKQAEVLESKNLELANQSEEIQNNAEQLSSTLNELRETQDQLLATARTAGRAEVATNVLHNVGNVLNSVNVSLSSLSGKLSQSRVRSFKKLSDLVNQHRENIADFMVNDAKGKLLPDYLEQLANALGEEIESFAQEVDQTEQNVEHIKRIIATQQTHARSIGINQKFNVVEQIDSAITISIGDENQSSFEIGRDLDPLITIDSDKHKVLDILINLLKNAKESITANKVSKGLIHVSCHSIKRKSEIQIRITDNGIGIDEENIQKLFSHGFTTKSDGHGFGLHSCAITAKSLGGHLDLTSPGVGKGATAILRLPEKSPNHPVESI